MSERSSRRDFQLQDMDCVTCALRLEKEMRKAPDVKEADANLLLEKITVTYDPKQVDVQNLEENIEKLGYRLRYKRYGGLKDRILAWFRASRAETQPVFREVRRNEFMDLVLGSLKPAILWITADRCPSCRAQIPSLRRLQQRYAGRAYFYQMDVMQARSIKGYEELDAPTLLLFNKGVVTHRYAGLFEETTVEEELTELLKVQNR